MESFIGSLGIVFGPNQEAAEAEALETALGMVRAGEAMKEAVERFGSWASEDFAPPLPRVNPSAEDSGSAGPQQLAPQLAPLARDSPDGARRQSYQTPVEAVPARYHTGITREDLYHRKGVVGETSSWYLPRHGRKPALDKADKKKAATAAFRSPSGPACLRNASSGGVRGRGGGAGDGFFSWGAAAVPPKRRAITSGVDEAIVARPRASSERSRSSSL